MEIVDLPIRDIDDEELSGWENGCDLVMKMLVESVTKEYLKTLQFETE